MSLIAGSVLVCFVISILIFSGRLFEEISWSDQTARTLELIRVLDRTRATEKDLELCQLELEQESYSRTPEEQLLKTYGSAYRDLETCIKDIERLANENKAEKKPLLLLKEELRQRSQLAETALAELKEAIRVGHVLGSEQLRLPAAVSKKANTLSEQIDQSIDSLEEQENARITGNPVSFGRAAAHAVEEIELLLLLSIAIIFFFFIFVRRQERGQKTAAMTELALQEREGRLRAIFENMGEGLYQLDQDGKLIYLNPAGAEMLGYDAEEIVGGNMHALIHHIAVTGNERSQEECELLKVIQTGIKYHCDDDVYVKKDGSLLPVRINSAPLFVDGRVTGVVVTFEDISELKEAERRATIHYTATRAFAQVETIGQAASKVLEAICQNLGWDIGAYWIRSEGGDKLDLLQIWQSPTNDFGEFEQRYRSQGEGDMLQSHYNAFVENAPLWLDARNKDADESFPFAARACGLKTVLAFPLRNEDECIGVIELFGLQPREPDIELLRMLDALGRQFGQYIEKRRVDKKLKDSEEIFKQLASNVHEVFWVSNQDLSKCLYISPAYEKDWGFSCHEALRDARSFLRAIVPEDRQKLVDSISPDGFSEEGREVEYRLRRTDGKERWIWSRVCPIRDEKDNIVRICGISHDITERKEVERRVSEFYSTVSHELRTPLTSIRAALGIIEGGLAGELSEKATQLVKIGRVESDRLIRLINDILDIRKIEAGKLELRLQSVEASQLVKSSFDAVHATANEARVYLRADVSAEAKISCDRDRVVQVLTNLLSNAVKFSPGDSEVTVKVLQGSEGTRFSVYDQGPGIPESEMHKLFGKFQQLDSSDNRKQGGTGLGLAITKAIVEEHRGKIGVNTRYGEGSCFWFELPNNSHIAIKSDNQKRLPILQPRQLLIIEDDLQLAELLRDLLSNDGFNVIIADTLKEATRAIEKSIPQVIILDLQLPDGNGLDWMQELREKPHGIDIPIIILTGREPELNKFGHPRLIDWLMKPFDEQALLRAIKLAVPSRYKRVPKVLVVDDDLATRELIIHQLRQLAVDCLEAKDGAQAIDFVRTAKPDLIVLDIGLPNPDGFGVVSILRQEQAKNTPLIVYTSREIGSAEREELTLGFTRHLVKSRTSERQFLSTVRELLDGLVAPVGA
jgi:PAS domain S-box-containing protein